MKLLYYADDLPITLSDIGQWWGSDKSTRKEVQIDIVGKSADNDEYIICSCKYRSEKIGIDELELIKHTVKENTGSDVKNSHRDLIFLR